MDCHVETRDIYVKESYYKKDYKRLFVFTQEFLREEDADKFAEELRELINGIVGEIKNKIIKQAIGEYI